MKNVIVVLGSGRSGTSLTMGLLHACGMRISKNLIPASDQNPEGSNEDAEIFALQRGLLQSLGPLAMPPPRGWLNSDIAKRTKSELSALLEKKLADPGATWGFKDPHTAYTLPMWHQLFNMHKVTPRYVLSVRDPAAVVTSMARQYGTDESMAELFWLTKYLECIQETGASAFIVHYEDLVKEGSDAIIGKMANFAGLTPAMNFTEIASAAVKPSLNRSRMNDYVCSNPLVVDFYNSLRLCKGDDFDRDPLISKVIEIRKAARSFEGWQNEVYRQFSAVRDLHKKLSSKSGQGAGDRANQAGEKPKWQVQLEAANEPLTERLISAVRAESESLRRVVELGQELERISSLAALREQKIAELLKERTKLMSSFGYQIGSALVLAVKKPVMKTLKFPGRVIGYFNRKRALRQKV